MAHVAVQVCPTNSAGCVLYHLFGFLQHKTEHVGVYLLLDWVKVEVLLFGHCLVGVGVHDDGQVLVDETNGEHFAIVALTLVEEIHSVGAEVDGTSENDVALHYWRLTRSPNEHKKGEKLS